MIILQLMPNLGKYNDKILINFMVFKFFDKYIMCS